MPQKPMITQDTWRLVAILTLTAVLSLMFLNMIRPFLMALVLAGISAAMARPLFEWTRAKTGGRSVLSAGLTLIFMLIIVVGPIIGVLYLAAVQAAGLADSLQALAGQVQAVQEAGGKVEVPDWVPFHARVDAWLENILDKAQDIAQAAAGYVVSMLSAMTRGAVAFFLQLFIFFYALFFFIQFDEPILQQILRVCDLSPETRTRIVSRVEAISRATLKGTLTIAVIQGSLGGFGFLVAGIPSVAFWTVLMIIAAMIPAVGATIVLFGGVIYLGIEGEYFWAGALAVWAALVVGTIDNILRPLLVGRDAGMPDLMILISTLGGLGYFGAAGLVLGPVLAGVVLTVWDELALTFGNRSERASDEQGEANL